MDNERLDALAEVIDMIEDALGKLNKMDIDFGLTEATLHAEGSSAGVRRPLR